MNLSDEAYGAALADLGIGPATLASLLGGRTPAQAWGAAGRGDEQDVANVWERYREAGIGVHLRAGATYPRVLAGDPDAPAVLFSRGDIGVLDGPRVSIVGTRRCTQTGREVAAQLGRELAEAGVVVVSGLALGIDGAAHEGALAAEAPVDDRPGPPVGVVGSGLDVVYPRCHERLWQRVGAAGALLSEAPLGARPEAWRFPARNRILAGLAQVVVVVESHAAGGSLHTVRSALERDVSVMAVPGSVRNPAAAGTNQLIADGVPPARDTDDVLVALSLVAGPASPLPRRRAGGRGDLDSRRPVPEGEAAVVLEAVGWEAASFDAVLARTRLTPGRAAVALADLEQTGWLRRSAGWYERVDRS